MFPLKNLARKELTNTDSSPVRFWALHLSVVSQEMLKNSISNMSLKVTFKKILTHCGLETPYGDIGLGQHWLR